MNILGDCPPSPLCLIHLVVNENNVSSKFINKTYVVKYGGGGVKIWSTTLASELPGSINFAKFGTNFSPHYQYVQSLIVSCPGV